jgi:hypothetical protein
VVAQGTPEDVARVERSFTGAALRGEFERGRGQLHVAPELARMK